MDSILEKITLYDILGYFFPGSVLVLMILFGGMEQYTFDILERWRENTVALYLAFIVASYLAGIVLSEVSEWIWEGTELCIKKLKIGQETDKTITFFEDQVADALIRSGEDDSRDNIKEKLKGKDNVYYKKYIYGRIQGGQDYKRIHSYASAYVMYKNIATSLLIGCFTLYWAFHVNFWFCVGGIFLGMLMAVRSQRFKRKKDQYALIWFMEKYGAKEPKGENSKA